MKESGITRYAFVEWEGDRTERRKDKSWLIC